MEEIMFDSLRLPRRNRPAAPAVVQRPAGIRASRACWLHGNMCVVRPACRAIEV